MLRLFLALALLATGAEAADRCYEASVLSPTPVLGNDGEVLKLSDGTLWEIKYEYEYMYEYNPSVIVCPGKGKIGMKGKMLNAEYLGGKPLSASKEGARTEEIIESRIEGEFEGWEGDTLFELTNGQIWQQIDGSYVYRYKFGPRVMIFKMGSGYEMQVEGMDRRVKVTRLK